MSSLIFVLLTGCKPPAPVSLDDPAAWTAHPADGVTLALAADEGALRLDYAFAGGGYAIARREVDLDLPADYVFRFRLRGEGLPNHLEFKLIDDSGENVWWHVWRDLTWPASWQLMTARKRQLEFAWGPQGGGQIRHVAAIEFAVTAGQGGAGRVWIDDLQLVPREAVAGPPPATSWTVAGGDGSPTIELDLGRAREFGGLTIDWVAGRHATEYAVDAGDDDAQSWRELIRVTGAGGGRQHLYLPESEARRLRLRLLDQDGANPPAVAAIEVQPLEYSATREAFFTQIAREVRRGLYPRGFVPEQVYWTVVGVDADSREGLLSEDGALEVGPGEFSLEPFLFADHHLITWADVTATQALICGDLPLPAVTWQTAGWRLEIAVTAEGQPGASALMATYRLTNTSAAVDSATLFLAVRPFQVDPPSQTLNLRGGTAPIAVVLYGNNTIFVDGRPRVVLPVAPARFGATTFAGGDIVADFLERGELPLSVSAADPQRAASAAGAYPLTLEPGASAEVALVVPLHEETLPATIAGTAAAAWAITGPAAAAEALATLKAQLGYILVNRAGPAIQPGARSYARSWIRDGALTGEALLRLGHAEAAREFLDWFAVHQYDSGKIPCVVDWRGADPVPEHDSTGEFIYLVTEVYRYTHDQALLERMWPRVLAGIGYLESLLAQRRTDAYLAGDQREFYGILPPSISHEGYSAKPMHSYWDDFWALRGFKDAAWLAEQLASPDAPRLAAARDRFAQDLAASLAAAMARHDIDYVPGCADLGDFDATSTTIAITPTEGDALAPPDAIERTFERYWECFTARRGAEPWEAFTPYELRNVGAFVHLGWRDRAQEALDFFLSYRRPAGWRQWAEVVWRDPRTPHFIGDMPHTWVGSDYIRSVLDMFVYEDRRNETLILAAGIPETWLENQGITVENLPTPYGALSYRLCKNPDGKVVMDIAAGLEVPAGGLVLRPPVDGPELVVRSLPYRQEWTGGS